MKIVFTGGGSGGHFYPIIAIAEALQDATSERHLLAPQLYFLAPTAFDEQALFIQNIVFVPIAAGKLRRYFSLLNFFDVFKTAFGFFQSLGVLLRILPDVVVSKGGFSSVPVVLAAYLLGIPIIIHESDAKPGRANLFAAPMAKRIGVAFDSAIPYFPKNVQARIARIGIPIRKEVAVPDPHGAAEYLGLEKDIPTVLIMGGSLGSKRINDTVVDALPDLVAFANIIHQTGRELYTEVESLAKVVLEKNPHQSRYHVFPYLSPEAIRRSAGVANVVVSRAGTTTITEISLWRKPSILIPIPESVSHDQRTNAYTYAHTGAAVVLEEANLTPHILASEARRIGGDPILSAAMGAKGALFSNVNASRIIADEIVAISLQHEPAAPKS